MEPSTTHTGIDTGIVRCRAGESIGSDDGLDADLSTDLHERGVLIGAEFTADFDPEGNGFGRAVARPYEMVEDGTAEVTGAGSSLMPAGVIFGIRAA